MPLFSIGLYAIYFNKELDEYGWGCSFDGHLVCNMIILASVVSKLTWLAGHGGKKDSLNLH